MNYLELHLIGKISEIFIGGKSNIVKWLNSQIGITEGRVLKVSFVLLWCNRTWNINIHYDIISNNKIKKTLCPAVEYR